MTLDIGGVLAGHEPEHIEGHWCSCSGYRLDEPWTAHVAAVLRERVAAWIADFPWTETARDDLLRALAAQVAPSRVPGEGS